MTKRGDGKYTLQNLVECNDPNPPHKDNAQGSGSAGSWSGAASRSTTPAPVPHTQYRLVTSKNALCDICNQRNRRTMQKCETCSLTTCSVCHAQGRYDARHNLANVDIPWSRNTVSPASGGSGRRRCRGVARPQARSGLVRQDIFEGVQAQGPATPAPSPAPASAIAPIAPGAAATAVSEVVARGYEEAVGEIMMVGNPTATPTPSPVRSRSTAAPRSEMTDASDHDELFRELLQEWSGSPIVARVRREEGSLQALDIIEAAATMMAMARGVPFSTNSATWLRRMRQYYSTA
ncbi:hypothetical protein PG991_005014 [Apiospora marii]|uniref:HTH CENPB-type domain-containing protein n=1 Tax=Apiospora marii TaxID=335849 RepID=A0ABR1S9C5_9PEZI